MDSRHRVFFTGLIVAAAVIVLRMLFLAASGGSAYRAESSNIAEEKGRLPAIRGRIFDKNNSLLAWSERSYDLILKVRGTPEEEKHLQRLLKKNFNFTLPGKETTLPIIIKYALTGDELEKADDLAEKYPSLAVELRWERRCSATDPRLGEVRQTGGTEEGISGWEKEFNDRLRGREGTFSVMCDRRGRWMNSTFRIITPPQSGEDIYLSEEHYGNSTNEQTQ